MPFAADSVLVSRGGRLSRNARKYSGVSTTLGNFVAATTVRVTGGGACAGWATADPAKTPATKSMMPVPVNRMMISRIPHDRPNRGQRHLVLAQSASRRVGRVNPRLVSGLPPPTGLLRA